MQKTYGRHANNKTIDATSAQVRYGRYQNYGNSMFPQRRGTEMANGIVVAQNDGKRTGPNANLSRGLATCRENQSNDSRGRVTEIKLYRKLDKEKWIEWWKEGYHYAVLVKELLPENVELYYFSITDKVWEVWPEDSNDGGYFDEGEPIKIDASR